jgi:aminoglycoside phosphotransferase (APT) family kinase protein
VGGINAGTDVWLSALEQSLYDDLSISPCRPIALQRTAIGRRFVSRAQTAFTAARPALAIACDVIHGDFSAGNVLCDDSGALAAVLDWQHGCVGHRGFDLIGLEWDLALRLDVGSAPSLALVTARVDELVEESVRAFCRAYYGVWNLSWALDTVDEEIVLRAAVVIDGA